MERFLRHRNQILKQVAESERWSDFLPKLDSVRTLGNGYSASQYPDIAAA